MIIKSGYFYKNVENSYYALKTVSKHNIVFKTGYNTNWHHLTKNILSHLPAINSYSVFSEKAMNVRTNTIKIYSIEPIFKNKEDVRYLLQSNVDRVSSLASFGIELTASARITYDFDWLLKDIIKLNKGKVHKDILVNKVNIGAFLDYTYVKYYKVKTASRYTCLGIPRIKPRNP